MLHNRNPIKTQIWWHYVVIGVFAKWYKVTASSGWENAISALLVCCSPSCVFVSIHVFHKFQAPSFLVSEIKAQMHSCESAAEVVYCPSQWILTCTVFTCTILESCNYSLTLLVKIHFLFDKIGLMMRKRQLFNWLRPLFSYSALSQCSLLLCHLHKNVLYFCNHFSLAQTHIFLEMLYR